MNFNLAELRNWTKTANERDTFQGYVYNDNSHSNEDGKFITIEADEVTNCNEGTVVTVKKKIYYLWNTFKRGAQ